MIDAALGGHVIKQRVARPGQGRSGGYRVLIAYSPKARSVMVFGFAKNARDNIEPGELATLKEISSAWLSADGAQIEKAVAEGLLQEVK